MSFLNQIHGEIQQIYRDNKLDLLVGPIGLTLSVPNIGSHKVGDKVTLYTHLVFREEGQHLYGFISSDERQFFLKLLKVRTLGPKLALSILSWDRKRFISACQNKDKLELTQISGVGPKMATKIITELDWDGLEFSLQDNINNDFSDFKAALSQLGFSSNQIYAAYEKIDNSSTFEEKIKQALKILGDCYVRS